MARFRTLSGPRGLQKRNNVWVSQDPITISTRTGTGTTEEVIAASDKLDNFTKPTIMRIVGDVWLYMVTSDAPSSQGTNDHVAGALGLYIEDGSATTPPALEVREGLERQLLWFKHFRLTTSRFNHTSGDLVTSAARFYEGPFSGVHFEVDVRGRRRLERFQHLLLLVSISSKDASDLTGTARFRTLLRE